MRKRITLLIAMIIFTSSMSFTSEELPSIDYIGIFTNGIAPAGSNGETWKFGFINTSGEWIVYPKYDQVQNFSDGFASVSQNGKHGHNAVIDESGNIKFSANYDRIHEFKDGIAIVENYANAANGFTKFGLINESGLELVDTKYGSGAKNVLKKNVSFDLTFKPLYQTIHI